MKKMDKEYARRHKGKYVDLTKPTSKKSKVTLAYKKTTSPAAKKKYKQTWGAMKKGARYVKGYVQGANDGLDNILNIPQKEPDFGIVTRKPRVYKKAKPKTPPKGYKLVKIKKRRAK